MSRVKKAAWRDATLVVGAMLAMALMLTPTAAPAYNSPPRAGQ